MFVDLGANDFGTLRLALACNPDTIGGRNFDVYAFEPDPAHKAAWESFRTSGVQGADRVTFVPKGAWIEDTVLRLQQERPGSQASTFVSASADAAGSRDTLGALGQRQWDEEGAGGATGGELRLPVVDFSAWLQKHAGAGAHRRRVVLKMDIEGAEYAVLDKMLRDGSIDLVDAVWAEWHNEGGGDRAAAGQGGKRAAMEARLRARGVRTLDWEELFMVWDESRERTGERTCHEQLWVARTGYNTELHRTTRKHISRLPGLGHLG